MCTKQMPGRAELGAAVDRLFTHFIHCGLSSFEKDQPLYMYRERGIINKMIRYYEQEEEYEKCCVLKLMQLALEKDIAAD